MAEPAAPEEATSPTAIPNGDPSTRIPVAAYLLGLTIFAVTTSEFMVAGMMPELARALRVSVAEIGYLIAFYALGMAIGGPLVTALLLGLGVPNKPALLWLLGLNVAGSLLAALATGYGTMTFARIVQGVASSACFGVSLTICAELVRPGMRGRAASIVLAGLTLSPVFGVPATTVIAQTFGWQAGFWCVFVLAMLSAAVVALSIPATRGGARVDLRTDLTALRNGRLWAAYATSGFVIGATFAAFSYVSPIFTGITGLSHAVIPVLFAAYGVANVIGNLIVGRFADRFTIPVLTGGLAMLGAALATLAMFAAIPAIAVAAFMAIGLVGVTLNPALVARVMRTAHPGPLVNSMHAAIITAGLAVGTWLGGVGIAAGYGLTAPLWVGVALAVLGLVSLAPRRFRQAGTR